MRKAQTHICSILDKHSTRKSIKSLMNMIINEIKQINLFAAFADIEAIKSLDGISL